MILFVRMGGEGEEQVEGEFPCEQLVPSVTSFSRWQVVYRSFSSWVFVCVALTMTCGFGFGFG